MAKGRRSRGGKITFANNPSLRGGSMVCELPSFDRSWGQHVASVSSGELRRLCRISCRRTHTLQIASGM